MSSPSVPSRESIQGVIRQISRSRVLRRYIGRYYLSANTWIWNRLPASWRSSRWVRRYAFHLHSMVKLRLTRMQSTGTFFFRNRPELDLLVFLLNKAPPGSKVHMTILGCSKGAEVYSISYAVRTGLPDLNLRLCGSDISTETLEFAQAGVYSLREVEASDESFRSLDSEGRVAAITSKDQPSQS